MPKASEVDVIERSLSSDILSAYYDKNAAKFSGDYPKVKDIDRVLDNLYELLRKIGDGKIHDETVIYVTTSRATRKDPRTSRYVITISKKKHRRNFAIRLFYSKTKEVESISTLETNQIIWSPDNMRNTKHPDRTKYYLGFIYMFAAE